MSRLTKPLPSPPRRVGVPRPQGPTVLEVQGAIGKTNAEGAALFDMEMLQALPVARLETSTAVTDGVRSFEGFLMRDLLAHNGAMRCEWLGREKVVDMPLMKQWRKQGYEKLCSLQAISTQNTNFGTTSICRIPLHKRHHAQLAPAATTGCVSCCSSDKGAPIWWNTPLPDEDELEAEAPGAAAEAAGAGKRKASEADVEDELDEETAKRLKALQGL